MIKNLLLLLTFTLFVSFTTTSFAQCSYTIEMNDTYGDGWNGNELVVSYGSSLPLTSDTITLVSGSFGTHSISVNTGDSILLYYLGGGTYNNEVSFRMVNQGGIPAYTSILNPGVGLHYTEYVVCLTCYSPVSLSSFALDSSVTLSWVDTSSASQWIVGYDTSIATLATGSTIVTSSNPVTISSLLPSTDYVFYVQSICSPGDTSSWSVVSSFSTLCSSSATPWMDNVESHIQTSMGTISNCWLSNPTNTNSLYRWNVTSTGTTPSNGTGPASAHSGSKFFYVESSNGGVNDTAVLKSPIVNTSSLTVPRLSFYYHMFGTHINTLYIDAFDGTTWNNIDSIYFQQQTSTQAYWLPKHVDLSSYTNLVQIRFRAIRGSGYQGDISIDDISINETPSCLEPNQLTVSNILPNSAVLAWTENGSATQWQVSWGGVGIVAGSGNQFLTSSNPVALSGLPSDSTMVFYVRSICSIGDTSYWAGPYVFSTPCNIVAPWTDDVNNHPPTTSSQIGNCWSSTPSNTTTQYRWNIANAGGTPTTGTGPATGNSPNGYFYIEASNGSFSDTAVLLMPNIDISNLTTPRLSFYYHMFGQHFNQLYVDVYNGTSWVNVSFFYYLWMQSPQSSSQSFWLPKYIDLSAFSGSIQVRFRAVRGNGALGDIAIDDISIHETPSCVEPTITGATNVSPTSAVLNWTENGSATQWEVTWGGISPSQVPVSVYTTTSNPDTLTSIPSYSNLFYSVRSICAVGDTSAPSASSAFNTPCSILIPWLDDVETHPSTTSGDISNCWSSSPSSTTQDYRWNVSSSGGTPSSNTGPASAHSGTKYFYTEASNGVTYSMSRLYTPLVDISSLSVPRMSFYYHMYGSDILALYILVYDSSSITLVDSLIGQQQTSSQAPWLPKFVDLSAFSGEIKIEFRALRGSSYKGDISLDDISIHETPNCLQPTALNLTSVSNQSAIIDWVENGSATQWQLEYGLAGFSQGAGTMVLTTDNPDTLIGLISNTQYEIYVRSVCGVNDTSSWFGPLTVTTLCNEITSFPFTESFEDTSSTRSCWGDEFVVGNTDWTYNTGSFGGSITTAFYGNKNARFVGVQGTNNPITKLVSPVFDIQTMGSPTLKFYYGQEDWSGDQNFTKVYYRVSSSSSWIEIWADTSNIDVWTMVTLSLPNPSATYQIAFEGINNYGYPNVIDEVSIFDSQISSLVISRHGRHTNSQYSFVEFYNSYGVDYDLTGHKLICNGVNSTVIDLGADVTGNLVVPANGFLVLSNNATQTSFESNWDVTFDSNTVYNSSGLAEIGNANTFVLKLGGAVNTNNGAVIDSTGVLPNSGEVGFQLPIGYWNNNLIADSLALVGDFESGYMNPALVSYVYSDNAWHSATGVSPSFPDSTTFGMNATILRGDATFLNNTVINKLGIMPNSGTNITNEVVWVMTEIDLASEASLSITGTGIVECYGVIKVSQIVKNGNSDYNGWGSPIAAQVVLDSVFLNTNKCNIKVFEASTQTWKYDYMVGSSIVCNGTSTPITSTNAINNLEGSPDGIFDVARGYFVEYDSLSEKTFYVNNGALGNGSTYKYVYHSQNGPITNGSKAWNYISNPYPSSISVNLFLTTNSSVITNAVYIYDNSLANTSYLIKNNTDNYDMASCQGFFVDASPLTSGNSDSIVFLNSMRGNNNGDFRSGLNAIYLSVQDANNNSDFARVYFDSDCSLGIDFKYDAVKMANKIFDFGSFVDNKVLIFNGVPELDTNTVQIPLYFKTNQNGVYTITIDSLQGGLQGKKVFLKDEELNKIHNLTDGDYQFSSVSAEWVGRFYLVIGDVVSSIQTIDGHELKVFTNNDELIVSLNNQTLFIEEVQVIDINGRVIFRKKSNLSEVVLNISKASSAIYFVKVRLSNGERVVQKIFVK